MQTKRVNIFAEYENNDLEMIKRLKKSPPKDKRDWCKWHTRYCGPNHERFWIEEESRWMNSWEEYKYVNTQDYYVDKPIKFAGFSDLSLCAICRRSFKEHLSGRECPDRILRMWFNKYTHIVTGIPMIYDVNELNNGRYTQ